MGIKIFFLFHIENICCGYSLEVSQQGTSNEYPQHIFLMKNKAGLDKSIAQLPRASPNFGWTSDFLSHLPRKMYRIYREYCNSKPFGKC